MKPRTFSHHAAVAKAAIYFRQWERNSQQAYWEFVDAIRDVDAEGHIVYHIPDDQGTARRLKTAIALWEPYTLKVSSHVQHGTNP